MFFPPRRGWLAMVVAMTVLSGATAVAAVAAEGPSLTPVPSVVAPLRLERAVSGRQDGIRFTLELDGDPLVAGQPAWVTTVENLGHDDIVWQHAALCRIGVWVESVHQDAEWGTRDERRSRVGTFRWYAERDLGDPTIRLRFTPRMLIGEGRTGCTDMASVSRIRPGRALRERARWDGMAGWKLTPPQDGRVRLTAVFDDYKRAGEKGGLRNPIEVGLDALVVGGRHDLLEPMGIVDAAIADPDLGSLLGDADLAGNGVEIYQYRPDLGLWEIGYFEHRDRTFEVGLVDPVSGEVRAIVERPWNDSREEFPE